MINASFTTATTHLLVSKTIGFYLYRISLFECSKLIVESKMRVRE